MAITNNDIYTTSQNVDITGSYMTFGCDLGLGRSRV